MRATRSYRRMIARLVFFTALLCPALALAHASDSGIRQLLPTQYFVVGGTIAVALSFLVLAALPGRVAHGVFRGGEVLDFTLPRVETVTGVLGLCIASALIWIGFTGTRDPLENLLPLSIWTIWWMALPLLTAIIGNIWALFEPWSGTMRVLGMGEKGRDVLPESWGYTPAIALFLGFAWFELVSLSPEDPGTLAVTVFGYIVLTFVMCARFGTKAWLARGECFSVFFRFISLLAPVQWRRHEGRVTVSIGVPGFAVLNHPPIPASGGVFIILALATLSFDGMSSTFSWLGLIGVNPLEFPGRSAVVVQNTLGLLGFAGALIGAFFLSCWLGEQLAGGDLRGAAARLALSILPISLAYHFAHFLTILMVNGQYTLIALNRQFEGGRDVFGLNHLEVTTSFLFVHSTVERIWWAQSGAIVLGHVLAVILAHAIASEVFKTQRGAALGGLPLALLMVGYTAFGLWLLAAPTGA